MAYLEGQFEQLNERVGRIETRLDNLEVALRQLRSDMRQQFFWLLGVVILGITLPVMVQIILG